MLHRAIRSSSGADHTWWSTVDSATAGLTIQDFTDFLAVAKSYKDTGVLPTKKKSARGATTVDMEVVKRTAGTVNQLYERATDKTLSFAGIEAEVAKLNKLNAAVVKAVAKEIGITGAKSKKAAIEAIQRKIVERKQSFERTDF